ncbi:MAG TPA: hypothetical protein VND93_09600 [Myxococcales bacterium]|nr:hypothetical protein [Myxococcales bacterium]
MGRARAVKLLALGLAVAGCAAHEAAGPSKVEGGEAKINLLARGFIVKGEPVSKDFGYYAYLVFRDSGDSTRKEREAAIHAFHGLLKDARIAQSYPVDKKQMAVLYAPVTRELEPETEEKQIFDAYDYVYAKLLTAEIARSDARLPRVCLIGTGQPLQPGAVPLDLRVVELKGDAGAIEETVYRFEYELLTTRPLLAQTLLEKVRGFFESVGGFVISIGTLGGGATPGKP